MSVKNLKASVIQHLEKEGYQFLHCLGEGGYGFVIAVRTPTNEQVAVKVIRKEKVWDIEDQYWPDFRHPNILQVTKTMTIDELGVNMYFTDVLPKVLMNTVHSNDFRKDNDSLNRMRKWFRQILSAIEYLHNARLCHLDIKSDNVLIDDEDNAVLCDFSGLNVTSFPIERFCSPMTFRPKEYFDKEDIQGEAFDLWSFGYLALNVLTGHYPQIKMRKFRNIKPDWDTQIWPIIEKTLKESKFRRLMKKAFPRKSLSNRDIQEALHFVKFIMKIDPNERPNAERAKKHPFLKIDSNPFLKDLNQYYKKVINPFRKNKNLLALKSQVEEKQISMDSEKLQPNVSPKRNVQTWFTNQFNRIFKRKQK